MDHPKVIHSHWPGGLHKLRSQLPVEAMPVQKSMQVPRSRMLIVRFPDVVPLRPWTLSFESIRDAERRLQEILLARLVQPTLLKSRLVKGMVRDSSSPGPVQSVLTNRVHRMSSEKLTEDRLDPVAKNWHLLASTYKMEEHSSFGSAMSPLKRIQMLRARSEGALSSSVRGAVRPILNSVTMTPRMAKVFIFSDWMSIGMLGLGYNMNGCD
jgi:hypothetical protein